jgi:hypothetical protein
MFFRIIGRRVRRNQASIASHSIFTVRQPCGGGTTGGGDLTIARDHSIS